MQVLSFSSVSFETTTSMLWVPVLAAAIGNVPIVDAPRMPLPVAELVSVAATPSTHAAVDVQLDALDGEIIRELERIASGLLANASTLDKEAEEVLYRNLWDLYI